MQERFTHPLTRPLGKRYTWAKPIMAAHRVDLHYLYGLRLHNNCVGANLFLFPHHSVNLLYKV